MMAPLRPPIRVLLVGPSLDILGGQAVQLQRLLGHLNQSAGLEAQFLPVNPRLPRPLGWLQRVKYVRTLVTSLAYLASLPRAIWRSDVIHAFSAGYWSFLLAPVPAMAVGRALGRGVVLNYRTGEAEDHLARHGRVARPLLRLAHAIVVPSAFLVEVFRRHGRPAIAIANVVDLDRLPWRERTTLRPRFLSNRNLEPLYNVADVLRAFARIQAALPDAALTVVGQGSERARLEALRDRLGLRQVTFVGAVPPEAMAAHYDAHDVYLNAPTIDNMPTSLVEAFACGLPVVTSDAGGIPHLVRQGDNGLMVPQGDPDALADAALRLFREPQLAARLAATARRDVETRYTWPAVRPAWEALYASMSGRAA